MSLVAAMVVLAVATWVTSAHERTSAERGAEFGLGVAAMLLAGSLAWFPHFTHILIPILAAAGLVASRGRRASRELVAAAATTLFVFAVLAPAAIAQVDIHGLVALSHSAAWSPLLQLVSLPGLTALWLLVALARSLSASATQRVDWEPHPTRHPDGQTIPVGAAGPG
jgi:hypothetical protein